MLDFDQEFQAEPVIGYKQPKADSYQVSSEISQVTPLLIVDGKWEEGAEQFMAHVHDNGVHACGEKH